MTKKFNFVILFVTLTTLSFVFSGCLISLVPLPPSPPPVNISGKWSGVYAFSTNNQIVNFTLNLTQSGTSLTGTFNIITPQYIQYPITGKVNGSDINFIASVSKNEYFSFTGSVYGSNWGMSGQFSCYYNGVQTFSGAWSAEK